MIRRPPRSTQSRSSAASDVYKRQLRDGDVVRSEAQRHDDIVIVTVYLFGPHDGDPGQLLAVAQQQGTGDSVGEFQGVVVQETGDQCPALISVEGCSRRSREGRYEHRGAVVVFGGPAQEVPDGVAGGSVREPAVDVALTALGKRDASLIEPAQEAGGDEQLGAGVAGRGPAGGVVPRSAA